MPPERTERLIEVGEVSLLQQMEPHLQVHGLAISRVEAAEGLLPSEQHDGRLPDLIFLLDEAIPDDLCSPVTDLPPVLRPDFHDVRIFVDDVPRRSDECNLL